MTLDAYTARRFLERGVRFYHAENLQNFRTYCSAGGLLCRQALMREDPVGFTRFYSDALDAQLGVLGRVFGNLIDFGALFSRSANTVPNVYGPITLVFRPEVFSLMRDLRITPQSIATHKERWAGAALSAEAQVDELLQGNGYGDPITRSLQFCEFSCGNPALPLTALERVRVEPITLLGQRLSDVVRADLQARGLSVPVEVRRYDRPAHLLRLQALVSLCEQLRPPVDQHAWSFEPSQLPAELQALPAPLKTRLGLWCRYFCHGTVKPLRAQGGWLQTAPPRVE